MKLVPAGSGEEEAEVKRIPKVRDSKNARLRIAGRERKRESLEVKLEKKLGKKPGVEWWEISFIYCLFWCSVVGLICLSIPEKVSHWLWKTFYLVTRMSTLFKLGTHFFRQRSGMQLFSNPKSLYF